MSQLRPVQVAVIGTGGMARHHIRGMLKQTDTTHIRVVCEPSEAAYAAASELFREAGLEPPVNEPDFEKFLDDYGKDIDVALIVTPHNLHYPQAVACMEHGIDVLLEKPMVMSGDEAVKLIETRDRTGRLAAVAFNGSMSPYIRTAVNMLRSGELGEILTIEALHHQDWRELTIGTWRQIPEIAGGGYLFDSGAHMLNSVVDLAGEEFAEVRAWTDNRGTPVDIMGVIIGKLRSGKLVSMHGCGDTPVGGSEIRVFGTKGMLRTGVYGERLEAAFNREDGLQPVEVPPSLGTWQQFLMVRDGNLPNPCPPEVGLRMAKLWDAIQQSAAQNGAPVSL
ncbi:MAG: oxidoreductase [Anaerolineaceae bacterium]|nr:oxidoreductase [Anaerolineaceae bacterium]